MDVASNPPRRRRRRGLHPSLHFLAGCAAAVVGMLPWFLTGMRLPLQNLWSAQTPPGAMPLVFLPFSQYSLSLLFAIMLTGAGLAGLFARLAPRPGGRRPVLLCGWGLLLVQVVATLQTSLAVYGGLAPDQRAQLYFWAVLGVILLSMVLGLVVYFLVAGASVSLAAVALSLASVAAGGWLAGLLAPPGAVSPLFVLLDLGRWAPAVLTGLILGWCGLGTAGRVAAWVASLAVLLLVPAALTATGYVAGSRVLLREVPGLPGAWTEVFLHAAGPAGPHWVSLPVAALLGVVCALLFGRARRRRYRPPS